MRSDGTRAVCFFLDVGQGTSQVILLGAGRAVVIDGGPDPEAKVPLALLRTEMVHTIERLIVSHNDADHDGGAPEILRNYQDTTREIHFLKDRDKVAIRVLGYAKELNKRRVRTGKPEIPLINLQANGNEAKIVYEDPTQALRLDVVHPNFEANLNWESEPNSTCAVLRLECANARLLFSGDAPAKVWVWMVRKGLLKPRAECGAMTVPHHGGHAGTGRQLRRLYSQLLDCQIAIVSVGTTNSHNHPTGLGIGALRQADVPTILCTQLTERCCSDPEIHYLNGVVVPHPCSQSSPSWRGSGRGLACAGSVEARIGPDRVSVSRIEEHRSAVDAIAVAKHGHPLCRLS